MKSSNNSNEARSSRHTRRLGGHFSLASHVWIAGVHTAQGVTQEPARITLWTRPQSIHRDSYLTTQSSLPKLSVEP